VLYNSSNTCTYSHYTFVSSLQNSEFSLFLFAYSRTVKHADAGLQHVARSGFNIYGVSLSQYLMHNTLKNYMQRVLDIRYFICT